VTYAPDDLLAVVRYLNSQGAPWASLGIVGDAAHVATGGYHVGRDDLAAYGRLGYDYSVVESPRDANPTNAASALDFAGTSWWRPLTLWLVDQAAAGTPGTEDIREIIYTPDGQTVRRWDRLGIRSTGDSSHLYHTHISFFRDSEGRRGSFLNLIRRYFEGAGVGRPVEQEDDEEMSTGMVPAGFAFGDGPRKDTLIVGLGLGPVNGGQFGNKRVVLGLGADFTPAAGVELRVAIKSDGQAWGVQTAVLYGGGDRFPVFLPDGATKIDIGRVRRASGDVDTDAAGNVTASAATCPVWWDLEFEKR
jgi:hypothetical protein